MEYAIETSGLTKFYGSSLGVEDVDLAVHRGEVFGFLGPNGAGKTTTIRLFLGLLRPTRGAIRLLGKDARGRLQGLLKDIGYLPGDFGLYRDLTGIQYLQHFMKLRRGEITHDQKEVMDGLIERFGIDLGKRIGTYSKGMRQIVGILQAFMHRPGLLILDEPTTGLDPLMQEVFYELLREEKARGTTVFLSSHLLREVERVCDRVAIIRKGRVVSVEAVGHRQALLGKKITVSTGAEPRRILERVSELAGVRDAALRHNQLVFFYTGEIQALVRCLAQFEITDLICEPPDIEDVLLRFYRGDSRA